MSKNKYTCDKCGKEFKQKSNYEAHMNRKNPCVVEGHINKLIDKAVEPLMNKIKSLDDKIRNMNIKIENICKNSSNNIYKNDNMNSDNIDNDNIDNDNINNDNIDNDNIDNIDNDNIDNIDNDNINIDNDNIDNIDNDKQLTGISLFSGMGGDSLGMTNCGIKLLAYSEIIKTFRETHDLNFKTCKSIGSEVKHSIIKVTDKELLEYKGKIDMIFAGFPCQGFSNAGKKDINDPRNTLFREFLRTAKLIEPNYIIGENVKGLLSRKTSDNKNYIDIIVNEFEKLDYNVRYKVFKTDKYGIPQKRERLVIFGIKKHLKRDVKFPQELTTIPNLKNIIKFDMKGSIRIKKEDFDMTKIPKECILTDMENEEDENKPHPYLKLKAKEKNTEYKGKVHKTLLSFAKRDSPIHCEIIDIRNPSKTIICTYNHQPRLFVPLLNKNGYYLRCILPDELKQIQGFPADFEICGTNKEKIIQIGNAVPPPLIEQIIKANI
jgi:DNA (cytosine-5)-methyltransferase 1